GPGKMFLAAADSINVDNDRVDERSIVWRVAVRLADFRAIQHPSRQLGQKSEAPEQRLLKSPERGDANGTGNLVSMEIQRREEKWVRIAIIKPLPPRRLSAISQGQRPVMESDIMREHHTSGAPRHMRLAIHRRERGDISVISDLLAFD